MDNITAEVSSVEKSMPKTLEIHAPIFACQYLSGGVAKINNRLNYVGFKDTGFEIVNKTNTGRGEKSRLA